MSSPCWIGRAFFRELGLFTLSPAFVEPLRCESPGQVEGVSGGRPVVVQRVASLTVVMPWMRHGRSSASRACGRGGQMDQLRRAGPFLELPSIGDHSLLSAAIPAGLRGAPGRRSSSSLSARTSWTRRAQLDASGRWANQRRPSDDAAQSGPTSTPRSPS